MTDQPAETARISIRLDTIRIALVAAMVVAIPFALRAFVPIEVHSPHLKLYFLKVTVLTPLDMILALLAIAAIPLLLRRDTYRNWPIGLIGALAFTAATGLWLLAAPSPEGLARLVRLAGITGAIATVGRMSPSVLRGAVIWPLTVSIGFQATYALCQTFVWHNGYASPITARFDHIWTQGYGTMGGPYPLAAFAVLSIAIILSSGAFARLHPAMWVAIVVSSASLSTTFGRIGVVSALSIGGVYGIAWLARRTWEYLGASVATVLPMSIGIMTAWVGWNVRAGETTAGNSSGREGLLNRAFTVIEANPIFGVGPSQMGPALARIGLTEADVTYVHNVPVLVAAEYGVPLGVVFTLWLVALGMAALFTSARATAVFVSIVPYLLLDHTHLVYVYALAEFGLWLAILDYHRAHRDSTVKAVADGAEMPTVSVG